MLQFDIENLIAVALSNIYLNFIGKLPQKMACFEIYVKSFPYQKSSSSRQLQQLPFFSSQQSRKIPRVQIKDDLMLRSFQERKREFSFFCYDRRLLELLEFCIMTVSTCLAQ